MSDENNVDENHVSDSKETVAPPGAKPSEIAAVLLEISNQDDKKWLLDNIIGFNRNVEQKTSILFAVTQNETPKIDEDGYPTAQDYQAYKQEMAAVASYIGVDGFEMEYIITAKGYPYAVISREPNEKTGQVTELHIILNEQHERLSNREYVLQKHRFAADGAESASAEIVDFYLVDCATLEVTDEHTTQWHKTNRS